MKRKRYWITIFLISMILPITLIASSGAHSGKINFPPTLSSYNDSHLSDIGAILSHRVQQEPLNLMVTLLFLGAIIHTFMASKFQKVSKY